MLTMVLRRFKSGLKNFCNMNEFLSTTKKCRFELNVLPAKQTGLNYSWQPILSWKRWSEETRGTFFLRQICGQITENHKEKDEKTNQKCEQSCGQLWFPWTSSNRLGERRDDFFAWESRDESRTCTIENWTVVVRGYFSQASSYHTKVASAPRVA